jgi:hypothetical protein
MLLIKICLFFSELYNQFTQNFFGVFAQFYVGLMPYESEEYHRNYMIAGKIYPIIDK